MEELSVFLKDFLQDSRKVLILSIITDGQEKVPNVVGYTISKF